MVSKKDKDKQMDRITQIVLALVPPSPSMQSQVHASETSRRSADPCPGHGSDDHVQTGSRVFNSVVNTKKNAKARSVYINMALANLASLGWHG